jgi:hypothetical protein
MRRHRRRALCFTFSRRQFASASSSARAMAIMGHGMDFTVHTGFMAATLTGAGTIITGTDQDLCVEAAVSAACFDFLKSRLLQLLIQRRKIGLQ